MSHKINIKDTNVAGIKSEQDILQRIKAARTEKEWEKVEETRKKGEERLYVWRIEKFQVKEWPQQEYGNFFNGDSYIVFHSYKDDKTGSMKYDVHFWLGSESTLDEKGTAAIKTVELDTLLDDVPVQHREVEGHESDLFISYFKNGILVEEGGIESGFHHVEPEKYQPRLLQIKGRSRIHAVQVPLTASSLNLGDAFILDDGLTIYVWEPKQANHAENYTAATIASNLRSDRGGKPNIVNLDEDGNDQFWAVLGGKPDRIKSAEEGGDDRESEKKSSHQLWILSDEKGSLEFNLAKSGTLSKSDLASDDVCVVDMGSKIFVWVGKGANETERKHAMLHAMKYAQECKKEEVPITRLMEGSESNEFLGQLAQQ